MSRKRGPCFPLWQGRRWKESKSSGGGGPRRSKFSRNSCSFTRSQTSLRQCLKLGVLYVPAALLCLKLPNTMQRGCSKRKETCTCTDAQQYLLYLSILSAENSIKERADCFVASSVMGFISWQTMDWFWTNVLVWLHLCLDGVCPSCLSQGWSCVTLPIVSWWPWSAASSACSQSCCCRVSPFCAAIGPSSRPWRLCLCSCCFLIGGESSGRLCVGCIVFGGALRSVFKYTVSHWDAVCLTHLQFGVGPVSTSHLSVLFLL